MTIRKKASTSAAKAGSYKKGTQITCYGERSGWTTVRYSGVYCYVSSQYLSESKPEEDTWEVYGTATGQSVVDYAMQFRGNPYVWGGESLTNGVDCSGFTMQVYKHFGYSLPHSSTAQRYEGTAVSWNEKQPGDLICYQVVNGVGHVAIYIEITRSFMQEAKTQESMCGMLITELYGVSEESFSRTSILI